MLHGLPCHRLDYPGASLLLLHSYFPSQRLEIDYQFLSEEISLTHPFPTKGRVDTGVDELFKTASLHYSAAVRVFDCSMFSGAQIGGIVEKVGEVAPDALTHIAADAEHRVRQVIQVFHMPLTHHASHYMIYTSHLRV